MTAPGIRSPLCRLLAAALLIVCWGTGSHAAAQDPCTLETPERVVAIGDIHGAYDQFVRILQAAEVIDDRERWVAGRALLVQTGDVLDRGPESRRVLDLRRRLEGEAEDAGGRVFALLGNHEVMRMVGDWRFVSAEEFAAFRTLRSEELREAAYRQVETRFAQQATEADQEHDERAFREQFMEQVPLGLIEMRDAFSNDGRYGRWLRDQVAMARINGVVFVHGGVTEALGAMGCEAINARIRREVTGTPPTFEQLPGQLSSSPTGPLWDRSLAFEPEPEHAPFVDSMLKQLDARAIVIGHTPVVGNGIAMRFDGRVIQIDTGMLDGERFPGGEPSALEMQGGRFTAIYVDRRELLEAP